MPSCPDFDVHLLDPQGRRYKEWPSSPKAHLTALSFCQYIPGQEVQLVWTHRLAGFLLSRPTSDWLRPSQAKRAMLASLYFGDSTTPEEIRLIPAHHDCFLFGSRVALQGSRSRGEGMSWQTGHVLHQTPSLAPRSDDSASTVDDVGRMFFSPGLLPAGVDEITIEFEHVALTEYKAKDDDILMARVQDTEADSMELDAADDGTRPAAQLVESGLKRHLRFEFAEDSKPFARLGFILLDEGELRQCHFPGYPGRCCPALKCDFDAQERARWRRRQIASGYEFSEWESSGMTTSAIEDKEVDAQTGYDDASDECDSEDYCPDDFDFDDYESDKDEDSDYVEEVSEDSESDDSGVDDSELALADTNAQELSHLALDESLTAPRNSPQRSSSTVAVLGTYIFVSRRKRDKCFDFFHALKFPRYPDGLYLKSAHRDDCVCALEGWKDEEAGHDSAAVDDWIADACLNEYGRCSSDAEMKEIGDEDEDVCESELNNVQTGDEEQEEEVEDDERGEYDEGDEYDDSDDEAEGDGDEGDDKESPDLLYQEGSGMLTKGRDSAAMESAVAAASSTQAKLASEKPAQLMPGKRNHDDSDDDGRQGHEATKLRGAVSGLTEDHAQYRGMSTSQPAQKKTRLVWTSIPPHPEIRSSECATPTDSATAAPMEIDMEDKHIDVPGGAQTAASGPELAQVQVQLATMVLGKRDRAGDDDDVDDERGAETGSGEPLHIAPLSRSAKPQRPLKKVKLFFRDPCV